MISKPADLRVVTCLSCDIVHASRRMCSYTYTWGRMSEVFVCPLCKIFSASSCRLWLSHLGQVHKNDASFLVQCGYNGCAETKKSYSVLYSHVYRKHPELVRKRNQALEVPSQGFPLDDCTIDEEPETMLSGKMSSLVIVTQFK